MAKILSIRNALFLIFITFLSITIATYIENSQSKQIAWENIYSSFWFEALFYLIIVFLVFIIIHFKMYVKEKLPSLLFHLSFIVIIIGALITKHYGYKGQLFVSLEKSSDTMVLDKEYLEVKTTFDNEQIHLAKEGQKSFNQKFILKDRFLTIHDKKFVKSGKRFIEKDTQNGRPMVSFEILTKEKREKFLFEHKNSTQLKNIELLFNIEPTDRTKPYFKIESDITKRIQFISNIDIETNYEEKLEKNVYHELSQGILYNLNGHQFLINSITTLGKIELKHDENGQSGLIVDVKYKGQTKELVLFQNDDIFMNLENSLYFDNQKFTISFGKQFVKLPFSIKLNNYKLENYAGSSNIYNYESSIDLKDQATTISKNIKINQPLTYGFFTIFQTPYENHDATLLDINYNPAKWIIYFGYFLLTLGLLVNLFNPKSRFRQLLDSTHS